MFVQHVVDLIRRLGRGCLPVSQFIVTSVSQSGSCLIIGDCLDAAGDYSRSLLILVPANVPMTATHRLLVQVVIQTSLKPSWAVILTAYSLWLNASVHCL